MQSLLGPTCGATPGPGVDPHLLAPRTPDVASNGTAVTEPSSIIRDATKAPPLSVPLLPHPTLSDPAEPPRPRPMQRSGAPQLHHPRAARPPRLLAPLSASCAAPSTELRTAALCPAAHSALEPSTMQARPVRSPPSPPPPRARMRPHGRGGPHARVATVAPVSFFTLHHQALKLGAPLATHPHPRVLDVTDRWRHDLRWGPWAGALRGGGDEAHGWR